MSGKFTGKMQFYNEKEFAEVQKEMEGETPRGSAIVGHAYVEGFIDELLIKRFVRGEARRKIIESRPFYQKVDWCFWLGIISKTIKDELILINEIRNRFAHHIDIRDFDQGDIPDKCNSFSIIEILQKETDMDFSETPPGEKYQVVLAILWMSLKGRLLKLPKIEEWLKPF